MKKTLLWLVIITLITSMLFIFVSCKTTTAAATTAAATTAAATTAAATTAAATTAAETTSAVAYPATISGEVSLMTYWTGGVEADALAKVIEQFEKEYTNIKITALPKPGDEIFTAIQTNLASNDPVDAFMFWAGDERLQLMVEKGWVAPLTDIYEKTKYDEIAPGVKDWARFRGFGDDPYTMPIQLTVFAFWYNMKLFEQAGIKDVPITWTDFIDTCKKLKAAGIWPLGKNGGTVGSPTTSVMDKLFLRTDPDDTYRVGIMQGKGTWDDPKFKNADKYWDEISMYYNPDDIGWAYGDAYQAFARGEFAMQHIGNWIPGSYETEMGLVPFVDYDVFAFPSIDPNAELVESGGANTICLSMKGKDNQAAQAWVAYWARPETQKLYCDLTNNLPAIPNLEVSSPIQTKLSKLYGDRKITVTFSMDSAVNDLVVAEFEKRSFGKETQDEAVTNLNKIFEDWSTK